MTDRPIVAVLDAMPEASRAVISEIFGVDFDIAFVADNTDAAKRDVAVGATVLLTMWGAVDAATIQAACGAKLIQKLGVGTDKIDISAATAAGITVLKAAGI
ncbi:MAG TPA: hypothetical protein VHV49_21315, partial [Pseudonocardiaceae bacterium]|nr:hypothetical protein [Pseudonocardiaceae bacterium]